MIVRALTAAQRSADGQLTGIRRQFIIGWGLLAFALGTLASPWFVILGWWNVLPVLLAIAGAAGVLRSRRRLKMLRGGERILLLADRR